MTTNGGDVVFVVNSFLSGIRMGKRSTTGGGPFMLFHLNAARILRGLRKGGATGREVGLRHGCGPSAEMRGVHRRVRLSRKCRRRQMRSPPGVPARSGEHL